MRTATTAALLLASAGCAPTYPMRCGPDIPTEYACEGWTPRRSDIDAICAMPGCGSGGYAICIHYDPATGGGGPPDQIGCTNGTPVIMGRFVPPP